MEKDGRNDFEGLLGGVESMLDTSMANLYRMTDICFDGMTEGSVETCKRIYSIIGELRGIGDEVKGLEGLGQ